MAPNGKVFHSTETFGKLIKPRSPRAAPAISTEGLQRAFSDVDVGEEAVGCTKVPPAIASEVVDVEDAKCECCGMTEECTAEYVSSVREEFAGRWICGLCSEAVKEEGAKDGGRRVAEALEAHMSECARFNRIERTQPVLFQTEAMKKILRKSRAKSSNGRERDCAKRSGGISRSSSSCI